jgi:hypothetical protein
METRMQISDYRDAQPVANLLAPLVPSGAPMRRTLLSLQRLVCRILLLTAASLYQDISSWRQRQTNAGIHLHPRYSRFAPSHDIPS